MRPQYVPGPLDRSPAAVVLLADHHHAAQRTGVKRRLQQGSVIVIVIVVGIVTVVSIVRLLPRYVPDRSRNREEIRSGQLLETEKIEHA